MLDGVVDEIDRANFEDAKAILDKAVGRQRETIRELRDLSFALEPVVLRDQGFGPAVQALADQVEVSHRVRVDLDIDAGGSLADRAQIVLYQIIRESLDAAIRRGPPTRISVAIGEVNGGAVETVITDDGSGERRRRVFEALEERARTLQGSVDVDRSSDDGGTAVADHAASVHSAPQGPRDGRQHLLFVWKATGYEPGEREGELPAVGTVVELEEGRQEVNRVAPSPLPGDDRRAAYLQPLPG